MALSVKLYIINRIWYEDDKLLNYNCSLNIFDKEWVELYILISLILLVDVVPKSNKLCETFIFCVNWLILKPRFIELRRLIVNLSIKIKWFMCFKKSICSNFRQSVLLYIEKLFCVSNHRRRQRPGGLIKWLFNIRQCTATIWGNNK